MSIFKPKQPNKVVLFIHGLENKPPKKLLKKWYLKSFEEGFEKYQYTWSKFDFEVVYWADLLYNKPLDPVIKDVKHPLYLDEPYVAAIDSNPAVAPGSVKQRVLDKLEGFVDGFFLSKNGIINVEYLFDLVASWAFKDLHTYYRKKVRVNKKDEEAAKEIIRRRLHHALQKHKDKKILLIAHSMGSIVAYDVLTFLAKEIRIHTVVTVGSPLGLPVIKREIFKEFQLDYTTSTKLPAPDNIMKKWVNIADLDDKVAINYNLNDDYEENVNGIAPVDFLVRNDYQVGENKNPHKSFGYLRSKPMIETLQSFLLEKDPTLLDKVIDYCKKAFNIKTHSER